MSVSTLKMYLLRKNEMASSGLGQCLPPVSDMEPGMGKSAAILGLSDTLEGAELELQKMLIDVQMKNKNHRDNFLMLKTEHTSLQMAFTRAQGELRRLLNDKRDQQENHQLLLAKQQDDLLNKNRELEELRHQVMTPHRLELLKTQVQQEMEAPVREQFKKLEEETERYRSKYYKLQYENSLLQSQMEHQRQQSALVLEERRIRSEAKFCQLEKEREALVAQYQGSEALRDGKRMELLLGEKAQLHLRVKGLEAEVAELRAQKENLNQQAECDQRLWTRQLSEAQATLKTTEAARQSLQQDLDRTASELHVSREQNSQLTGKLHKAQQEVNKLTCQIQSLKHSYQQESASVKLECARSKEKLERERLTLLNHIDGLQADVEVLKKTLERNKEFVVTKERKLLRKVESARQDGLRTAAALHEEKLKLETRVAELEQQRVQEDTADKTQKEEWEERLRKTQRGEESAHIELQHLRNKLYEQSSQLDEVERQKAEITDLQLHNQELGVRLAMLSHSENELMGANQHLRETLDRAREDLRTAQAQAEKSQHEAERLLEERRVDWLQEKHKLQEHDTKLQQKYCQVKEKLQRAAVAQKKRKTLTENKEKRLQDKIQLLEAKVEELKLEVAVAKKHSPFSEEQAQLKRRLKELQQQHNEFQRLLMAGQGSVSLGPAPPLTSAHNTFFVFGLDWLSSTGTQQELLVLRQRLENLESAQQQQQQGGAGTSGSGGSRPDASA